MTTSTTTLLKIVSLVAVSACVAPEPFHDPDPKAIERASVGGWNARPGTQPWFAAIYAQDMADIVCGGTLVHPRFVLTAAHCFFDSKLGVAPSRTFVRFNEFRTADPEILAAQQRRSIRRVHVHAGFRPRVVESDPFSTDDMALVELSSPVTIDEHVKPIELTSEAADDYRVLGWGDDTGTRTFPAALRERGISDRDPEDCASQRLLVGPNEFCAGQGEPLDSNQRVWIGDSGAPVLVDGHDGDDVLLGVVSRSQPSRHAVGVYTRVSPYIPWIQAVTQDGVMVQRSIDPEG